MSIPADRCYGSAPAPALGPALTCRLAACLFIGLLLPLFATIACLIRTETGRPAFTSGMRMVGGCRIRLTLFQTRNKHCAQGPFGMALKVSGLNRLPVLFDVIAGRAPMIAIAKNGQANLPRTPLRRPRPAIAKAAQKGRYRNAA